MTGVDRRFVLRGAVAALGLHPAARLLARAALAEPPSREEIWAQQRYMNALGPRYTGHPAHLAFLAWLEAQLQALGLDVYREDTTFTRWTARRASLTVYPAEGEPLELPVASPYPYSAPTLPEGVAGALVHGGRVQGLRMHGERVAGPFPPDLPDDLTGRIVYLEAPAPALPFAQWYADRRVFGGVEMFPDTVSHAAAAVVSVPDLTPWAERGARAVLLGWSGVGEEQARGQYLPFNRPPQPIPGLWLGPAAAARLAPLARAGARAQVALEAVHAPAVSRTLYAELPGASPELIALSTHTDGPNAVEDNGAIGILALARRLARTARARRPRSVLLLLSSGHFVGPQADSSAGFLRAQPQLRARLVAGLAVEHLGAMEWADRPDGRYAPTGAQELALLFASTPTLADLAYRTARADGRVRGAVMRPRALEHFFGEGRALARAGVPALGFLPAPSYLLSAHERGHLDKLDARLMHAQIGLLARIFDRLQHLPRAALV